MRSGLTAPHRTVCEKEGVGLLSACLLSACLRVSSLLSACLRVSPVDRVTRLQEPMGQQRFGGFASSCGLVAAN